MSHIGVVGIQGCSGSGANKQRMSGEGLHPAFVA